MITVIITISISSKRDCEIVPFLLYTEIFPRMAYDNHNFPLKFYKIDPIQCSNSVYSFVSSLTVN